MILSRDKAQGGGGGLTAPDIERYYNVIILAQIIEWANAKSKKIWVNIESTLSGAQLNKNVWVPSTYRMFSVDTHQLTSMEYIKKGKIRAYQELNQKGFLIDLND